MYSDFCFSVRHYLEASQTESARFSNRLSITAVADVTETYSDKGNGYDLHGNMLSIPHLSLMRWDFKDRLNATSRQVVNDAPPPGKVAETTYCVYDAAGQRVRKVTERQNGSRKNQRIYLGGFELYREYDAQGSAVVLERETLHVMDDKQRVALVETKTITNLSDDSPMQLARFQLGNHLGSASLELDAQAKVISYEEYFPYGSTSYQALNGSKRAATKRYRSTGKERDEETGFSYHGARYYAGWLGRWIGCDPAGTIDGANLYCYVNSSPILLIDPTGYQGHLDDELDAGAPPQTLKSQDLHIEKEEDAKANKADLPPGGAAPPDMASHGYRPAETNKHANAWAAKESKKGIKAGAINFVASVVEGGGIVPNPLSKAIRSFAPETDTALSQNVAAATEAGLTLAAGALAELLAPSLRVRAAAGVEGRMTAGLKVNLVGGKAAAFAAPTEAEMLAPLNAERLGGTRVWLVGPPGQGGASTTRAIRVRGNLVTYDTRAPANQGGVRADMKAIANQFGDTEGVSSPVGNWLTGTHGDPAGNYGGALTEKGYFSSESRYGKYYGWNVHDVTAAPLSDLGESQPMVLNWCYSSACVLF